MPRALWNGGIRFGLVFIPIKLYSGASRHDVDLNMLRKGDQCPIKFVRVCKKDGEEVPWKNIVKGHKEDDDYYVTLTDEDFKKAKSGKSESIDIEDFVNNKEINPRYFEKPYLLEPQKGAGKTYNLLRKAIYNSGKSGVARFVLRSREHLALLMADEKVLYLTQMRFHDELRKPDDLKIPSTSPTKKEMKMAEQLIDSMSAEWKPEKYKDNYQKKLRQLIKAKKNNKKVKVEEEEKDESTMEDLVSQLKKSLEMA
jgi:DNA end-binding protein Ku